MEGLAGFIILALLVALYLLPGIFASSRDHPQTGAIWVLTILAGWTMIGWVGAMVWAFTNTQRVVVEGGRVDSVTPPPAPQAPAPVDIASEIERFAKLHASGALTDEEFAAKKRQLLGLKEWEPVSTGRGTA